MNANDPAWCFFVVGIFQYVLGHLGALSAAHITSNHECLLVLENAENFLAETIYRQVSSMAHEFGTFS